MWVERSETHRSLDTWSVRPVGYGFGFPIGRTLQLTLVQDAAAVIHERTGLRGGQSSISQFYTTRLGVRYGLGSRRGGVR